MSRSRTDSDDLPGDSLDDILEADDEPHRPSFNDSDEFDASALLSQPFFDDSNGDLNVNESEFADIEASRAHNDASSGDMNLLQANFRQQQQQQQNNNFSSYDQNTVNQSSNQPIQDQMNFYSSASSDAGSPEPVESLNRALSAEETIALKVQEVQRKIQQVQQQIERVQLESSNPGMQGQIHPNGLSSPQQQQPPQGIQDNFDMQAMMNQASVATRNPPGRSVSMPIRRNHMQGSSLNQPMFMMQQPMQELQRQQALMGNSQGSGGQNGMNNMQGFNHQQGPSVDQQHLMMGNVVDGSGNSPMRNMQNFVQMPSMEQQQAMMGPAGDISVTSAMNNMQGLNIGVSLSMDGSMNSSTSNMQQGSMSNMQPGFNLDNSVRSMPGNMGMDPTMFMMQQQAMGNMAFGGDGQAIRQNSLPHANSSNIAMMQNDLLGPTNFDLAQMQRAFQAQGLIPGPAGSMQGQMGQPGQSPVSMEKLCESMRRSAMSRSLVKQLSGRSLSRGNSGRGLTKTHSGRSLSRQNSGGVIRKQVSRANSGRSLQRTASGRQPTGEAGAELPVRRVQDSKHRIQRDVLSNSLHTPKRGVLRHQSHSAVIGGNNEKTVLNIDGNSVGMF